MVDIIRLSSIDIQPPSDSPASTFSRTYGRIKSMKAKGGRCFKNSLWCLSKEGNRTSWLNRLYQELGKIFEDIKNNPREIWQIKLPLTWSFAEHRESHGRSRTLHPSHMHLAPWKCMAGGKCWDVRSFPTKDPPEPPDRRWNHHSKLTRQGFRVEFGGPTLPHRPIASYCPILPQPQPDQVRQVHWGCVPL